MTPEEKRRNAAAVRVAYTATRLSEALTQVSVLTKDLEDRLVFAESRGVPMDHAEAMTRDLEGIDVAGMIRRAYLGDDKFEVTGRDTVMYCLRHRRKMKWMPSPGWWIHDDHGPLTGHPGDPRGCSAMWDAPAPIEIRRREPGSCRG